MHRGRGSILLARVLSFAASALLGGTAASAQPTDESPDPPADQITPDERQIVVTGKRGSAVIDVAPIAEYDADAIAALGAATMGDVLRTIRGATQSADGSEPIYLLNAQRVSGFQEIGSLPPEALEKIEVLPEQTALRFGFPPTRRVINFITKRRFRQIELRGTATALTRGGSTMEAANAGLTRLRDDSRLTLGLEYRHTDPLLQSDRRIAPDPDVPFDALGNITGLGGGEIDPALSDAAGQLVTIAPVPEAAADRASLGAYASSANNPRLFDIGPYGTMVPRNHALKAEAVLADRIGEMLAGSFSVSAEQSRDSTLGGPARMRLTLPETNPYSPFAGPVVLNRCLTETDPLAQNRTTTTLRAGVLLRGAIAGWRWDFTGAVDHKQIGGLSEREVDPAAANAAIAAGADPFAPLDASLLAERLTDRTRQRTRSVGAKMVATNTPLGVPAGNVTVTATAEAERLSAVSILHGSNPFDLRLNRVRLEGGLAVDVPLASRREGVLPFLGELSANASVRARDVAGFGALHDSTYGLAWAPLTGVQLLATARSSASAPDMTQLSSPVVRTSNVPVYDPVNGRTELVTLTQGGNPDLLAERRRARSLTLNLKPFAEREWRLALTYEATRIRNQTGTVYAITPETEASLPDLIERDASGRLVAATLQPTNFALQRQRTLSMTVNLNGRLGPMPPPAAPGSGNVITQVPSYFAGIGPTIRLADRLQLRPGGPELDLLHGGTITGAGTSRVQGYAYAGINHQGYGMQLNAWYSAPNRVRTTEDLRFSSILRINLTANLPVNDLLKVQKWAKGLQLRLDVNNLLDDRQQVRDASGAIPNRYQSDYLDPTGRTATLSLRKLF